MILICLFDAVLFCDLTVLLSLFDYPTFMKQFPVKLKSIFFQTLMYSHQPYQQHRTVSVSRLLVESLHYSVLKAEV